MNIKHTKDEVKIFKSIIMKKHIVIIVLFILNTLVSKSQTEEKYLCFSDIKLSYVHSSKGGSGYYKANMQTIIPYGIGLSGTFKICKRIYIDIGLTYKKEKKMKHGIHQV